jgi:hypothetical protein
MQFLKRVLGRFFRSPDVIIGSPENPYLLRWHVIPRNRFFNIYLHKFLRDDDDRALHDHPWASCSIILRGGYIEHTPRGIFKRKVGKLYTRKATDAHRIQLFKAGALDINFMPHDIQAFQNYERINSLYVKTQPVWTIFITGPKVREWGFHCRQGWRHWREFCNPMNSGEVGRGCE